MASTRIATPPRVKSAKKSASTPEDPMITQARAVAETINQLRFGRTLKNPVPLPFANKEGTDFLHPLPVAPSRPKTATRRRSSDASLPALERHRRKCIVCKHPDREEIEEEFIHWRRPGDITYDFGLEDSRYLRRHAHALGLYALRRENYLFTLENFLERGDEIELTAASYIKAVRAYACMCDTVRWTEPAIRVVNLPSPSHDQSSENAQAPPNADPSLCSGRSAGSPRRVGSRPSTASSTVENKSMAAAPSSQPPVAFGDRGTQAPCPEPARQGEPAAQGGPSRTGQPVDDNRNSLLPPAHLGEQATVGHRGTGSQPVQDNLVRSAPSALSSSAGHGPRDTHHESQHKGQFFSPTSNIEPPTSSSSNRPSPRLETAVTARKQRKEAHSNRPQFAK